MGESLPKTCFLVQHLMYKQQNKTKEPQRGLQSGEERTANVSRCGQDWCASKIHFGGWLKFLQLAVYHTNFNLSISPQLLVAIPPCSSCLQFILLNLRPTMRNLLRVSQMETSHCLPDASKYARKLSPRVQYAYL